MSQRVGTFTQDPDEELDYTIDWSIQLDGDTIEDDPAPAWTITPSGSLTIGDLTHAPSNTTTTTTVWLKADTGTAGTDYQVQVQFTTAAGRVIEGHFLARIR